ncbi:MAG: mechanosensitive ion channel family protein [Planctomycetota bacterium]
MLPVRAALAAGLALTGGLAAQGPAGEGAATDDATRWFGVPALQPAQTRLEPHQLATPQATLELFLDRAQERDWQRAAAALDVRYMGDAANPAVLAEQFYFVLQQQLWIDWGTVPDRPDGLIEPGLLENNSPVVGRPRRGIRLGNIEIRDRLMPIQLHRIKAPGHEPIWVFAAQTVKNVPALYEEHGPSGLAQMMPSWARERGPLRLPIWQWIGLALALVVAPAIGIVSSSWLARLAARNTPENWREVTLKIRWPICLLVATVLVWVLVNDVLGLPSSLASFLRPATMIATVAAFVWLLMRIISIVIDSIMTRSLGDDDAEQDARRRALTQVKVARHVIVFGLAIFGIAIVLLQLNSLRSVGVMLLSSAGAMAVILGIAGHAVLGNLVAGLHIAFTQPFRIGDIVVVEGHWGRIEDISYVNVVVRTWDERRLVFPIRHFVEHWFENWSKTDEFTLQTMKLKVDYRARVEDIRSKFEEIVTADEDFDTRKDPEVLVTECGDETVTLRMSAGGKDASAAWRMINRVRESTIRWLQDVEGGAWLPRRRLTVHDAAAGREAGPSKGTGKGDGKDTGDDD